VGEKNHAVERIPRVVMVVVVKKELRRNKRGRRRQCQLPKLRLQNLSHCQKRMRKTHDTRGMEGLPSSDYQTLFSLFLYNVKKIFIM
jgi:hypothetical protein